MQFILNNQITKTLSQLHREASRQGFTLIKGISKSIFRPLRPEDLKDAYIAISEGQGKYIYDLLLKRDAKHIVEFGTSFGISTLYLGAAAKRNGGKVVTTELLPEKCRVAQRNFEKAGLDDVIDIWQGDAMETLRNVEGGIDFLLMDGWNDLYLPLIKILEPKFKKGTLIYTDNASFGSAQPFINYIHSNPDKYRTERLYDEKGGSELSMWIAD